MSPNVVTITQHNLATEFSDFPNINIIGAEQQPPTMDKQADIDDIYWHLVSFFERQ